MFSYAKKMALGLLAGSLLALGTVATVEAGGVTGKRKPQVKYVQTPSGKTVPRLTPGTTSDSASDYGLGISAAIGPNGLRISRVDAYSPAERVGLEVGDVLLTVNGFPITTVDDWIFAMEGRNTARLRIKNVRDPYGAPVYRQVYLR